MKSPKKPGVAFCATVALVVVLVYPLSFGPVAWIVRGAKPGDWSWDAYHAAYFPLHRIRALDDEKLGESVDGRGPFCRAIDWYLFLWGGGPYAWLET